MSLFSEDDVPAKPKKGRAKAAPPPAPAAETPAPDSAEEKVGALVEVTRKDPVAVFTDEAKYSEFYQRLAAEVAKHEPDLTTAGGRKAIASLAFRVTKAKTSLDKAGLGLTEEWRNSIALVNASRKKMTGELDQLAAEVRRPLTEWEGIEAARVAANAATIIAMRADAVIQDDDTSATVEARGRAIHAMIFEAPQWTEEEAEQAITEKGQAVYALAKARNALGLREREAAELAELRALKAERDAKDEADRIAREEAEAAEREATSIVARKHAFANALIDHAKQCAHGFIGGEPQAYAILHRELTMKLPPEITEELCGDMVGDVEAARVTALAKIEEVHAAGEQRRRDAAEAAERERLAAAKQEATEEAQRIADQRAQQERERIQREHEAALADEREKAAAAQAERDRLAAAALAAEREERAKAEKAATEERERVAAAERARQAEEKRLADIADAQAKLDRERAENQEHRREIKSAIKAALIEHGAITEAQAIDIVKALVGRDIPHVEVKF